MKKISAGQIQNIVFTGIIAAAAVLMYVLAGRNLPAQKQDALFTLELTVAPEMKDETRFERVPETIFLEQINGDTTFTVVRNKQSEQSYQLICDREWTGSAALTYTLDDDDCMESVTLTFVRRDQPPNKPRTEIERYLANDYPTWIAAQNKAIQILLPNIFVACDLNDVLIEPILMKWYTGALAARDEAINYSDTYQNCIFLAYPSQLDDQKVIICSLLMP
ncbi:MAG: hypothetical protein RRZ24_05425 [Clostridia bacterium]